MKKLITTAVCSMAAVAAFGQGSFAFSSTIGGAQDNTITIKSSGTPADAPYQAEVAVGVGTTLASLTLYPGSITPLSTGWIFGPTFALTGVTAGSTVAFDVLVWNPADGATFAAASTKPGAIFGSSGVVQGYVTGGAGSPPSVAPNPAFGPFTLAPGVVPEPTTLALGAMGLGALLLRRRK
jgi:hypothetical protein